MMHHIFSFSFWNRSGQSSTNTVSKGVFPLTQSSAGLGPEPNLKSVLSVWTAKGLAPALRNWCYTSNSSLLCRAKNRLCQDWWRGYRDQPGQLKCCDGHVWKSRPSLAFSLIRERFIKNCASIWMWSWISGGRAWTEWPPHFSAV